MHIIIWARLIEMLKKAYFTVFCVASYLDMYALRFQIWGQIFFKYPEIQCSTLNFGIFSKYLQHFCLIWYLDSECLYTHTKCMKNFRKFIFSWWGKSPIYGDRNILLSSNYLSTQILSSTRSKGVKVMFSYKDNSWNNGSNQMLRNVWFWTKRWKIRMFDIHKDIWSLGSQFIL